MNRRTKNRKPIVVLTILICLFSACRKEPSNIVSGGDAEVNFTSRFELQPKASGSVWSAGDKIGVRMIDATQATVAGYANRLYTANVAGVLTPATNNAMYYPVVGDVGFAAYYPYDAALVGSSYTANLVNQASPANIDLLWAKTANTNYNKTSGTVPLTFSHQLSKMVINTKPDKGLTDLSGLTITIKGMNTQNTFNILSGTWGTANTISNMTAYKVTDGILYEALVLPAAIAAGSVTVDFVVKGKTYTWNFPATTFQAKYKYEWNVTISDLNVSISAATITPWSNAEIDENVGDIRLGDYKNGGIVYWIDPTNDKNYKIVSLDEQANTGWSASNAYVLGRIVQDNTSGWKNQQILQNYSKATVEYGTTGNFSKDFPAAGYCYNYQGRSGNDQRGTWYLPAKDELLELSKQCRAADNIIENALANNDGTPFTTSDYWSSTEHNTTTSNAWDVSFSTDNSSANPKNTPRSVRCLRQPAAVPLPAVGGLKDGGVIYWINPLDPENYYKVVMLVSPSENTSGGRLIFSSDASYLSGIDDINGYENVKVMQTNAGANFVSNYPAAAWCSNYTGEAKTDPLGTWYLPARGELQSIHTNKAAIDATLIKQGKAIISGVTHWSSTQNITNSAQAYMIDLSSGLSSSSSKTAPKLFRCVRVHKTTP